MVLSTYNEDKRLLGEKYEKEIEDQKKFKETKLPEDVKYDKQKKPQNPFLDRSVRSLIDSFVLTWHKILMDLLDTNRYKNLDDENEWWDKLYALSKILIEVFWIKDRIFFVGVGLVIMSFFVFFILASY